MEDFLPYQEALQLKQLGFDETCLGWYDSEYQEILNYDHTNNSCGWLNNNHCTAPTYAQSFRFFRKEYLLHGYATIGFCPRIDKSISGFRGFIEGIHIRNLSSTSRYFKPIETNCFDTIEEAELACLIKLIEIAKNEQTKK